MKARLHLVRRALLPAAVFLTVGLGHYSHLGIFPETAEAGACCPADAALSGACAPARSWWEGYIATQGYWLGLSYAMSLAFAAVALRRYREERLCGDRNLALGGVTFSGLLALAGCYLLGCCGSPMLAVYLSLFGAGFLPLAKPLVAALTVLSLAGAWWWMTRQSRLRAPGTAPPCCGQDRAPAA